jgi:hypothetical protein
MRANDSEVRIASSEVKQITVKKFGATKIVLLTPSIITFIYL